ncbi:MAG: DUF4825 domain-containing protein [Bacilli bacterium]|nr:DUF4825 domain-containing protein [Bacilli bacterium]
MDVKKIGKFIAYNRKNTKLTQEQLGEKLGVSSKTISRWENGNYMPDLSLLKPLSEELGITLNELLSGEKIETEKVIEHTETSLMNTIDYSKQRLEKEHNKISIWFIVIGIIVSISALTIFEAESSWCSIYSIIGIIIFTIGIFRIIKIKSLLKKISLSIIIFIAIFSIFNIFDYIGVVSQNRPPIYRYIIKTEFRESKIITYNNLFYNVYRINADTLNEYYIVDKKKEYTIDTIPISPFNRAKSGIDNIIKYKNKYIGNNSNTGNLLYDLPLAEYGFVFEIDSKKYGVIVNYNTTDWYKNDNLYIERSLIYNSASIFLLIDNVEYIKYNFSGSSYTVTKNQFEKNYLNYEQIKMNAINKDKFNQYIEQKMNDYEFIEKQFNLLFNKI